MAKPGRSQHVGQRIDGAVMTGEPVGLVGYMERSLAPAILRRHARDVATILPMIKADAIFAGVVISLRVVRRSRFAADRSRGRCLRTAG